MADFKAYSSRIFISLGVFTLFGRYVITHVSREKLTLTPFPHQVSFYAMNFTNLDLYDAVLLWFSNVGVGGLIKLKEC